MADISQIKLPDNTVLNLKDTVARNAMVEAEAMANVESMLDSFGLDYTTDMSETSSLAGLGKAGSMKI